MHRTAVSASRVRYPECGLSVSEKPYNPHQGGEDSSRSMLLCERDSQAAWKKGGVTVVRTGKKISPFHDDPEGGEKQIRTHVPPQGKTICWKRGQREKLLHPVWLQAR